MFVPEMIRESTEVRPHSRSEEWFQLHCQMFERKPARSSLNSRWMILSTRWLFAADDPEIEIAPLDIK
jgi:hypothetical protein